MHLVENFRVLVDVASPFGDLVLHGGNAVDDGHEALPSNCWPQSAKLGDSIGKLASRQAERPQGVKVH